MLQLSPTPQICSQLVMTMVQVLSPMGSDPEAFCGSAIVGFLGTYMVP